MIESTKQIETLLREQTKVLNYILRELTEMNDASAPTTSKANSNPCAEISLGPSKQSQLGKDIKNTYIITRIDTKDLSGVKLVPLDEFYNTKKEADLRLKLFLTSYPDWTIKLLTAQEYFDLKNQNLQIGTARGFDKQTAEEDLTKMLTQLFESLLGPPPEKPAPRDLKRPWSNN